MNRFIYFRREFLKLLPPLATLCHGNDASSSGDCAGNGAAGEGGRQALVENGTVQVG